MACLKRRARDKEGRDKSHKEQRTDRKESTSNANPPNGESHQNFDDKPI